MKIIVRNENNACHYVFQDTDEIVFEENIITTPNFIIGDLGSSTATLFQDITDLPEDWENGKYLYDQSAESPWSLNPDWVDTTAAEDPAE